MISIIIPIYNVEKYLDDCISSVAKQTFKDLEIILVDDGSTDSSGAICDKWALADNRIEVFHKSNGGLSSARNYGIDRANGEYIAFVDSDDYISEKFIEVLYSLLVDNHTEISACGINLFEDGKTEYHSFMKSNDGVISSDSYISDVLRHKSSNSVWNKLYRKSCIGNLRFKEGIINEDFPFTVQLLSNVKSIAFSPEYLYYYRMRKGSITKGFNPRCGDYVANALWAESFIPDNYPNIDKSLIKSYKYQEMIGLLGMLAKHGFPCEYKDKIDLCAEELKKNFFKILFDKNINLKQRIKLLIIYSCPTLL